MEKKDFFVGIRETIERLADQAVSKFVKDSACMDETIAASAEAEGLSGSHIDRIVQAANKKAFIRIFPERHEFEVASKEGVEKIMNKGSAGKTKKASVVKPASCDTAAQPYGDTVNYNLLDLIKPASEVVVLKTTSTRHLMVLQGQIKRAIEELSYEARRKRADVLKAENNLITMSKQAMLRGATFGDLETYALSLCDGNKKVAGVIDGVYEKVKDMRFVEKQALCRGGVIAPFVGSHNPYTDTINKMIKIAHEDLPVIENGLAHLNAKLAEVNGILEKNNVA